MKLATSPGMEVDAGGADAAFHAQTIATARALAAAKATLSSHLHDDDASLALLNASTLFSPIRHRNRRPRPGQTANIRDKRNTIKAYKKLKATLASNPHAGEGCGSALVAIKNGRECASNAIG